jgi:hypothetical protein
VDVFLVVFMEKKSLASEAQADKKVWDNASLTHSLCLSVSLSVSSCGGGFLAFLLLLLSTV